jgi:hypothetical protein
LDSIRDFIPGIRHFPTCSALNSTNAARIIDLTESGLPAHPKGARGNNLRRVVGAFIFPPALRGNLPSFEECIKHPSRFINGNGLIRLANALVNGVSDPLMMFLFDRPEHFIRALANLGNTLPPTRNFLFRNGHLPLSYFRSFFYPEFSILGATRHPCS